MRYKENKQVAEIRMYCRFIEESCPFEMKNIFETTITESLFSID